MTSLFPGDRVHGRYEVLSILGSGGMGTVYEVRDPVDGGRLALKTVLAVPAASGGMELLRHEFSVLAGLDHPHVIRVRDFGLVAGGPCAFFTMDLVEGEEFRAAARRAGLRGAVRLAVQVCRGLEYVHARGVVHQDLKPANVLVRPGPGGGQAVILDFGLAGAASAAGRPALRGTLRYMAPEVLRGDPVDARADLYALGVLVYEAVAGRAPFEGGTASELAWAHVHCEAPPPSEFAGDCPPGLEAVVLRLLSKEPARRHRSANEVILDLNERLRTAYPLETHATRAAWIHTGRLVGREREVRLLESLLAAALEGRPRVVLLEGEAGMGKTRLLRELRHRAQLAGAAWCPWEGGEAALRGVGAGEPPVGGAAEDPLPWSVRLAGWLLSAARDRPVVLALDDLHRAQGGAVELVGELARRLDPGLAPGPARLLVLAGYRPDEAGTALQALADRAAGGGSIERMALAPLSGEEAGELVRSMLPVSDLEEVLTRRVLEEAAGNPLHVEATVAAAAEAGCLVHQDGRWRVDTTRLEGSGPTASIRSALRSRVAARDPDARELLGACAVAGASSDYPLLLAATGWEAPRVVRALAELERARLVRVEGGRGLRVAQGVLEEVARDDLAPERRAEIHAAVLSALLVRRGRPRAGPEDEDVMELARHALEAGGRVGDAEAGALAAAAARRSLRLHDPRAAEGFARQARSRLGGGGPEAVDLLLVEARARFMASDFPGGRRLSGEALDAARAIPDPAREGQALLLDGRLAAVVGDLAEALGRLRSARACLEGAGERLSALEAALEEGVALHMRGRPAEARPILEGVLAAAAAGGPPAVEARASLELGWVLALVGSPDEAMAHFRRARELYRSLGHGPGAAVAVGGLGTLLEGHGRLDEALEANREALEGFRAVGYSRNVGVITQHNGRIYSRRGLYRAALEAHDEVRDLFRRIGDEAALAALLLDRAQVLSRLGREGEALADMDRCLEIAVRFRNEDGEALVRHCRGVLHREVGDYARALEEQRRVLGLAGPAAVPQRAAGAHQERGRTLLELGAFAEARRELGLARAAAPGVPPPAIEVEAALLESALAAVTGDPARALGLVEGADRRADEAGDLDLRLAAKVQRAGLLLDLGRAAEAERVAGELARAGQGTESALLRMHARHLGGRSALARGAPGEAVDPLREAMELARRRQRPRLDLLGRAGHDLALALEGCGLRGAAARAYRRALAVVRLVLGRVPPPYRGPYLAHPDRARLGADAARFSARSRA